MHAVIVTNRVKRYVNGFKIMIDPLIELGYEVTWVADFSEFKEDIDKVPCNIYQVDFRSNPFNINNIKAYRKLNKFLSTNNIDLIHCNTPIGGLIGRICAKKANIKKVIYTAHGFHFYNGANFINNFIFKTGEKILAKYTDILITINQEDYLAATKFKLRNKGKLFLTHGAGIDIGEGTRNISKEKMRKEMGIPMSSTVIFSAGELNKNKNNEVIIKAMSKIKNDNVYYVLCGEGKLRKRLEKLAYDLGLKSKVIFLGFRTDVLDILESIDIFAMTSFREGLPRSLMEAMSAGLPCIVSKIRGNVDLIFEEQGGFLYGAKDIEGFVNAINKLAEDEELRKCMGDFNKEIVKKFEVNFVKKEMKEIYLEK